MASTDEFTQGGLPGDSQSGNIGGDGVVVNPDGTTGSEGDYGSGGSGGSSSGSSGGGMSQEPDVDPDDFVQDGDGGNTGDNTGDDNTGNDNTGGNTGIRPMGSDEIELAKELYIKNNGKKSFITCAIDAVRFYDYIINNFNSDNKPELKDNRKELAKRMFLENNSNKSPITCVIEASNFYDYIDKINVQT